MYIIQRMSGELIAPPSLDQEIFDSHFREVLELAEFERARTVFITVGRFNERSIAMQIDLARQVGKLEEVLAAYEKLMAPDSFLHMVPDFITAAVEVRRFGDVVYGSVIAEGEPMRLMEWRGQFESPKIFDLMGQNS